MQDSSPEGDRSKNVAPIIVLIMAGLALTAWAIGAFGDQQRLSSDLYDVRAQPPADLDSGVHQNLVWALELLDGAQVSEADVEARLSARFLQELPASEFLEETDFLAADAPFTIRGFQYEPAVELLGPSYPDSTIVTAFVQGRTGKVFTLLMIDDGLTESRIEGVQLVIGEADRGPFDLGHFVLLLLAGWALLAGALALKLSVFGATHARDRVGPLMAFAGLLWLTQTLELTDRALPYTLGLIGGPLAAALVGYLLFVVVSDRGLSGPTRWAGAAMALGAAASIAPFLAIDTSKSDLPRQFLAVTHNPDLSSVLLQLRNGVVIAIGVGALFVLARRLRLGFDGPFALGPALAALFGFGPAITVAAIAIAADGFNLSMTPALSAAALVLPLGALLLAVQDRHAVDAVNAVADVGDAPARTGLRDSLARALNDPSVELAFWSPKIDGYVDGAGQPMTVAASDDRAVTWLASGVEPVGAVLHDAHLRVEPERVRAACSAARLSLDNERLQATVQSQLADVRASRARLVESAEQAQRRVERNLHDGAQQRLLALLLSVQLERKRADDDGDAETATYLQGVADELSDAIEELRELGRGLHPSALDRGLKAAVGSLAERSPLPVVFDVSPVRCEPAIEAAAYFVIQEAVANAIRHATADHVRVDVNVDQALTVVIADDGAGGANKAHGSGLQSLEDRVLALGGAWTVESAAGEGTAVRAVLPCSSLDEGARS